MATQTQTNKTFKIIQVNISSLISQQKRHELNNFLQINKPQIVLIAETNISKEHKPSFKNFTFIRTDKTANRPSRGTGILVHEKIKHQIVNTNLWKLKSLETTAIITETDNKQRFLIVSAYRHYAYNLNTDDINIIEDYARNQNNCMLVLAGDFNARHERWKNSRRCQSGIELNEWLDRNAMTRQIQLLHTAEPTYYKGTYSSYLDLFLISENINVSFSQNTPGMLSILDIMSDHRAVELQIITNSNMAKAPKVLIDDFNKTDWKEFNNTVDRGLSNIYIKSNSNMSRQELDSAIENLTEVIQSTIETVVPKIEIHSFGMVPLPDNLKHLIAEKNRLRRRWQRKRYCHNDYHLRSEIKCLEKIIKDSIRIVHTEHWEKTLQNVKLDNHTFANIKKLTGRYNKNTVPQALKDNTTTPHQVISDNFGKANLLGNHFEMVHRQNQTLGEAAFSTQVYQHIQSTYGSPPPPKVIFEQHSTANPFFRYSADRHLVSMNIILETIKSRANKKSKGEDKISNFVLRKLSTRFVTVLATLFNQLYNLAHFPQSWKIALVIPLLKKDKSPEEPASYRPISLLSCMSKLYEHAIKHVIDADCTRLKVIPPDQTGFVLHKSTIHPLVKFTTDFSLKTNAHIPTIACMLDIEKAFDTVWIDGLLFKMHHLGFSQHICSVMHSYLKDRTFKVIIDQTKSITFNIADGVPQGSVLSALLYTIYVCDMPPPPVEIQRLQYADDILIYTSLRNIKRGATLLNKYIETLCEYFNKWKVKINPAKGEALIIKGKGKNLRPDVHLPQLKIKGQHIPFTKQIKYLGVIYTQNPNFIQHVNHALKKANHAYHSIRPILCKMRGLSQNIKLLCYKQLIRPVIAYAFPVWSGISAHQMERIRMFERKCIRSCITFRRKPDSYEYINNTDLYSQGNVERIDRFMLQLALKSFKNWPTDELFQDSIQHDENYLDDPRNKLKPPWYIQHLADHNRLFDDNHNAPILYHQRANESTRHLGPVYNMLT